MLIFGYAADSRIYLFEKETQELIQLTLDLNPEDSVSAEDLERRWNDQKRIAELETYENVSPDIILAIRERKHPYNFLGRPVVGKPVEPNPVICTRELKAGDIVIVMSDGICKNLTDRRIRDCLLENPRSSQGAAQALVEEAHETSKKYYNIEDKKERRSQRCSPDDMTAVVMKVE